jgi:predicted membrane protein
MSKSGGVWLGVILIAVGVLFLLDNMYLIDFSDIIHTYWPLLLIIWGFSMLTRRSSAPGDQESSSGRVDGATATVYPSVEANHLSSWTVFGDYTVAVQSESFSGGYVSTTFGNTDVDLLHSRLAEGEHSLKLDGVFGNTTLHLPADMAFVVFANTTFGDIRVNDQRKQGISPSLDHASSNFHTSKHRLRISVSRVFGNVRVIA